MVYEKKQEWKKAIAAYQKALDLNPQDSLAQKSLRYLKKRKKKRFKLPWQKA
jgi:tetratricopeptide (TPR) repeat protein